MTKKQVIQLINNYWRFDNDQDNLSSWHDKQDLINEIEKLTLTDVVSTCCDKVPSDSYYLGTTCLKCNKPFRQVNK